jgi:hypothetical protein
LPKDGALVEQETVGRRDHGYDYRKRIVDTLERRAERRADRRKAIAMEGVVLAGLLLSSKLAKAQSGVTDALDLCRNGTLVASLPESHFEQGHYGIEYGANRIALAYWRTVDPTIMDAMMPAFESVLAHAPNPVPAGQNLEAYFNANYQELGPGPAYPWFQSHLVDAAAEEKPAPSFASVLAETK